MTTHSPEPAGHGGSSDKEVPEARLARGGPSIGGVMRHEMIAGYRLYCLDELGKAAKWPRAASFLVSAVRGSCALDIENRTATILR